MAIEVTRVAVRDVGRRREAKLNPDRFTGDAASVVADPDIDVVVEVIGGLEPAGRLITQALEAGKPVVTANKELIVARGPELFDTAARGGVDLLFEASVAGGIPLMRPLRESLAGDRIQRVTGIVNGTTNFILTRMADHATSFADALAEAQRLGYAEADPSADVEGTDAAAKAAIIATIAFGACVHLADVHTEGIVAVTADDIASARLLGYVVKLLAIAEEIDGAVAVRADLATGPLHYPLASVRDSFNVVFIEGEAVGELMLYGRGAGGGPSASAVLGDLIDAAHNLVSGEGRESSAGSSTFRSTRSRTSSPSSTCSSRSRTAPACSPLSPVCSVTTACRSSRWSSAGWDPTPASCSSPTGPEKATCAPRSRRSEAWTRFIGSGRCCG